jgi:hypothetical protein
MKALNYTVNRTGTEIVDRNFDQVKRAIDSLAASLKLLTQAAAPLTNSVALTGTSGALPDFTNGVTYSTDYPALHATISQMASRLTLLEAKLNILNS